MRFTIRTNADGTSTVVATYRGVSATATGDRLRALYGAHALALLAGHADPMRALRSLTRGYTLAPSTRQPCNEPGAMPRDVHMLN